MKQNIRNLLTALMTVIEDSSDKLSSNNIKKKKTGHLYYYKLTDIISFLGHWDVRLINDKSENITEI